MKRATYISCLLGSFMVAWIMAMAANTGSAQPFTLFLSIAWIIFGFIRLDDSDLSNWWGICFFLPIVNMILFIGLCFAPSKVGG